MTYAEVAVDAPIRFNRTLTYSVPRNMRLVPGQLVWVSLGNRPVQGIVLEISEKTSLELIKDIDEVVESAPLISAAALNVACWISERYVSTLFDAVSLFLPPGFKNRVVSRIQPCGSSLNHETDNLNAQEKQVFLYVKSHGSLDERKVRTVLGKQSDKIVRRLISKGLVSRTRDLPSPKVALNYKNFVSPAIEKPQFKESISRLERAPLQMALLRSLFEVGQPILAGVIRKEFGHSALNSLLKKGLVCLEWRRSESVPQALVNGLQEDTFMLTRQQEQVLEAINSVIGQPLGLASKPFLLHGVTGSGKTEVYIRALETVLSQGKQGLLLVPEISMTPQIVRQLTGRFPGKVGVLHSQLSLREQFDQWWSIRQGTYSIVIGPRSALFAPLDRIGLIVLDEEHEWTYKQQEQPMYHARDVAIQLANIHSAGVILGSATPDVVSYYRAINGQYRLLNLSKRINSSDVGPSHHKQTSYLPTVEMVDMREELKSGNRSILSKSLSDGLTECVQTGKKAILFLNRRGSSTVVQCRACGQTMKCRRCDVSFTYHSTGNCLRCHQCNYTRLVPTTCPKCQSPRIRYMGLGTQRVVDEVQKLIPGVSILRWDRDTTSSIRDHQTIMENFASGREQVLVGTQMVAKGLHVPQVTLVGVIIADIGLMLPDFRAAEHTFQVLCQVVGRAGRGFEPGRAILQTYNPDNYALKAAAQQDFNILFERELKFRRQQELPPFNKLIHLVYIHTNVSICQKEAEGVSKNLRNLAYTRGIADFKVIGPAPAFPQRVRGRFRWHLILKGSDPITLLKEIPLSKGWTVDVDPVSVL